MYARELATFLGPLIAPNDTTEDVDRRLESLRGYDQLPRGRDNAGTRLSDEQIINVLIGFTALPGWAGHVALILGRLKPVGGEAAGFRGGQSLRESLAHILASEEACSSVVNVAFITEHARGDCEYRATMIVEESGVRRRIHFVSHMAHSLLQPGAELSFDADRMRTETASHFHIGLRLLARLRREVEISRHLDRPLKTDWREYQAEEERNAFHARLGTKPGSKFLNLPVSTGVAWPMEPRRIRFAGHHFVLFPKTDTNDSSISIDLTNEKLDPDAARTLLNRFLSLLSWCDRQYAVLGFGWSGNPVPVPIPRHNLVSEVASNWIFERDLPDDEDLLQRLAYYREGHNARHAGLVTFEVLSFFKVFEVRSSSRRGEDNPTKSWIRDVFPDVESILPEGSIEIFVTHRGQKEVAEYVIENCRIATAHASEKFPSDADSSPEIKRLYAASDIVHALARRYIIDTFRLSDIRF